MISNAWHYLIIIHSGLTSQYVSSTKHGLLLIITRALLIIQLRISISEILHSTRSQYPYTEGMKQVYNLLSLLV